MTSVKTSQPLQTAGTGSSQVVTTCQICGGTDLESIVFVGFLPPVNTMQKLGSRHKEQAGYPAELLKCAKCQLVQLGLIVDPQILFPPEYPYSSGTTKILRENFAELFQECKAMGLLKPNDLVVDIGSNDGTLLGNFKQGGCRVQGIEPSDMGLLAREKGIATIISFFNAESAAAARKEQGLATLVTATNVFAHMENIHDILDNLIGLLGPDGVFMSESHYLLSLVETLQYDTIYHEHLRYYSLHSLKYLLESHGLTIFHAKKIPTHGGSIRVNAAPGKKRAVQPSVAALLQEEVKAGLNAAGLKDFKQRMVVSKLALHALLLDLKKSGKRVYGIGAPSRASTLINYVGIDDGIMDCVLEVKGSHKVGHYMPGTAIPIQEESRLFQDPPDYAMLLSWHIADELIPKLAEKGFKGDFIVPLPTPRIVRA